jgi:hypothetical protein
MVVVVVEVVVVVVVIVVGGGIMSAIPRSRPEGKTLKVKRRRVIQY